MIINRDIGLYYEITGAGPPLLLLHGNGEDSASMSQQADFFKKHYRVISIDTRGHGKSGFGDYPLSFPLFSEDLAYILDKLEISRVKIIGFSDGGITALHFALLYPDRADKIAVIGANIFPKGLTVEVRTLLWLQYAAMLPVSIVPSVKKKREILQLMLKHPALTFDRLHGIRARTLILAGERDMVRNAHTIAIADNITDAQLCIFAGGDHFIPFKMANSVNKRIYDFFNEVSQEE